MSDRDQKLAIVTGASRGLVAALAERLGARDQHVLRVGRAQQPPSVGGLDPQPVAALDGQPLAGEPVAAPDQDLDDAPSPAVDEPRRSRGRFRIRR